MCELSGKLIAWLDGELPADEAAEVGRHLRGCAECRGELGAYERLSNALHAYCEAAMTVSEPRRTPSRKRLRFGAGAAAAAAIVALLFALPRARDAQPPAGRPPAWAAPRTAIAAEAAPAAAIMSRKTPAAPAKSAAKTHPRHGFSPKQVQYAGWQPAGPAIQISIPAEALLPPGAAPEGVNFVAEVSIAADGSAQELLVQP